MIQKIFNIFKNIIDFLKSKKEAKHEFRRRF